MCLIWRYKMLKIWQEIVHSRCFIQLTLEVFSFENYENKNAKDCEVLLLKQNVTILCDKKRTDKWALH